MIFKSIIHNATKLKSLFGVERKSYLPREYYISEKILKRENSKVFSHLWMFAGLTNELPEQSSWMVKKIGYKEILITRNGDDYFANENVCPHRNKRLMLEDYGRGPLVCGYHAWSFKPNGDLHKIPSFEKSYLLTENQLENACLTKYKLQVVGNFIFVNLSKTPINLEEQFNRDILKSLKLLSVRLHNSFAKLKETRNFNWKLNFENLRDAMHPAVVHANTLAKNVDFSEQNIQQKPLRDMLRRMPLAECSYFAKDGEAKKGKR